MKTSDATVPPRSPKAIRHGASVRVSKAARLLWITATAGCESRNVVNVTTPESDTSIEEPLPSAGEDSAPRDPFKSFGVVGFVLSLFAILNIAGLVISIVALVRSKRAGFRNRFALAGLVIASIGVLITFILIAAAVGGMVDAAQTCTRLGNGVHTVGNATYSCAPGSFYVTYGR